MYLSEVAVPFFQWNFEMAQVFANNLLFPQVSLISCGREVLCGHYFHTTCSHMQAMVKLIKEVLKMTNDDAVQYYAAKGL